MPTYRYRLVADIEVDVYNVLAAEKAVHGSLDYRHEIPKIRVIGSHI